MTPSSDFIIAIVAQVSNVTHGPLLLKYPQVVQNQVYSNYNLQGKGMATMGGDGSNYIGSYVHKNIQRKFFKFFFFKVNLPKKL